MVNDVPYPLLFTPVNRRANSGYIVEAGSPGTEPGYGDNNYDTAGEMVADISK